tara:strand:- start:214 stop:447 length:234 start_codon:yes stop_codon:yes gene_type:complete
MNHSKTILIRANPKLKNLASIIAEDTHSSVSQVMRTALITYAQKLGYEMPREEKKKYTAQDVWAEMVSKNEHLGEMK